MNYQVGDLVWYKGKSAKIIENKNKVCGYSVKIRVTGEVVNGVWKDELK